MDYPLALMGLGLFIIIGTAGFWSYNQKIQHPAPAPLPERIGGMSLTRSLVAEEAIAEFTRLHGDDFPLSLGSVGMYGVDPSVTLWVAGVPFQTIANRMLVAMRDKIAKTSENTPFSPAGERKDGYRTIYELDGMGQKHFYFQSRKLIILSCDIFH